MKLSLLNASHTLLSYPSFLKGYRKVDEAMHDEQIIKYVEQFMDIDITSYVPAPPNTDVNLYKKTLMERFANGSVSDQVARLCADGISKFPVYIMPNLTKMIDDGKDLSRCAFLFATYRHYLRYKKDDHGNTYEIAEPRLTLADEKLIISADSLDFLHLSAFTKLRLTDVGPFLLPYQHFVNLIKEQGINAALESILIQS